MCAARQPSDEPPSTEATYARIGRTVAGLVHNLRNMLAIVDGYNSLVLDELPRSEWRELMQLQRRGIRHLEQSLDHIMSVVRASHQDECVPIDLGDLVGGIVELYRADFDLNAVARLDVSLHERPRGLVANPQVVCHIVENLLTNARQAVLACNEPRQHRITVRTTTTRLVVRDTGAGILGLDRCRDSECREHFRAGRTEKRQGVGLGMPYLLDQAAANGWGVRITSVPDQGTLVEVRFVGAKPTGGGATTSDGRSVEQHAESSSRARRQAATYVAAAPPPSVTV